MVEMSWQDLRKLAVALGINVSGVKRPVIEAAIMEKYNNDEEEEN